MHEVCSEGRDKREMASLARLPFCRELSFFQLQFFLHENVLLLAAEIIKRAAINDRPLARECNLISIKIGGG